MVRNIAEIITTRTPFFWHEMVNCGPKTSENLLHRRNVFTLPSEFSDVFGRWVLFPKAKNALFRSEVLIQRS